MTAHVANDGMTFVLPGASRANTAPRRGAGLARRLGAAVAWLAGLPRRQAVMEELGRMSDHELADIGLARADLPRVFDPAFVASRMLARKAGC